LSSFGYLGPISKYLKYEAQYSTPTHTEPIKNRNISGYRED
jgi:hypothetical protein